MIYDFTFLDVPAGAACPASVSPQPGTGSAGGAQRHLQQDHLPVLGRVAFVDVSGESRRAVKDGGAVLARVHL